MMSPAVTFSLQVSLYRGGLGPTSRTLKGSQFTDGEFVALIRDELGARSAVRKTEATLGAGKKQQRSDIVIVGGS